MGITKDRQAEHAVARKEIDRMLIEQEELRKLIVADIASERQRQRYRALGVSIAAREQRLSGKCRDSYDTGITVCNYYNG